MGRLLERPGIFFVRWLLAHANMRLLSAGLCNSVAPVVVFGPEFHGNLNFWR